MGLDFSTLETLQKSHPAWRLLQADHAPLVASFLHKVFVAPNLRGVERENLISLLEDVLWELRTERGNEAFPRSASEYLDSWTSEAQGWLRKYYPMGKDEAWYDLTPATEKALTWLESLFQREFVGTESRLLTVFELLRQLVHGSGVDPEARLADLERRRSEIDHEIEALRLGLAPILDEVALRDRFQEIGATARGLLSDFREVEQNFRMLDRQTRETIALWSGSKGELLGKILVERDAIADSDQGRSFRAFWNFLMDPSRQEELGTLLEKAFSLPSIAALEPDRRLRRIHFDWLEAGEQTQKTVATLSRQLRRFLDDQAWLESRRIMQILHQVEILALEVRDSMPTGIFTEIDALSCEIDIPLERPLYSPPITPHFSAKLALGDAEALNADQLYEQVFVDRVRLQNLLEKVLKEQPQITFAHLIESHPLKHGLAELLVWLSIATSRPETVFDESVIENISWRFPDGEKLAKICRIIFVKDSGLVHTTDTKES